MAYSGVLETHSSNISRTLWRRIDDAGIEIPGEKINKGVRLSQGCDRGRPVVSLHDPNLIDVELIQEIRTVRRQDHLTAAGRLSRTPSKP